MNKSYRKPFRLPQTQRKSKHMSIFNVTSWWKLVVKLSI